MPLERNHIDYKNIIAKLSAAMHSLSLGDLSDLRRMNPGEAGPSAFWRLAVVSGCSEDVGKTDIWMRIIKIIAILTPKGERTGDPIHDAKRSFGAALCDGGDPRWSGSSPLLSESRLMRFLAERNRRGDALERIARMLAAKRKSNDGINCNTIAELLLFPDSPHAPREIARAYYQRLDRGSPETNKKDDN